MGVGGAGGGCRYSNGREVDARESGVKGKKAWMRGGKRGLRTPCPPPHYLWCQILNLEQFLRRPLCIRRGQWGWLDDVGFALPVAIVAKCEEKYFWHKKNSFGENKWRNKILLPKNRHLNITDLGYFMPLNRQLTSWITCIKSVADQLIHYDNTFR